MASTQGGQFLLDSALAPSIQVILLAALAIAGIYIIYQKVFHPLASIPGPFSACLSRYWLAKLSWDGGTHVVIPDLHKKYGPLVRIGPNELSVTEPSAVKQIYSAGSRFRKSDWYSVWQGRRKFDLFPETSEEIHREQKRLVGRYYAMDELRPLESYIDETLKLFFKRLEEIRGQAIDLGLWIQLFAFDVVGELTFSRSFGFLEAGKDDGSFGKIQAALQSASWVGQVPWLYWLLDYLSPIIGTRLAIANRHGTIREFVVKEVEARKDRGSDRKDILSKLFKVHGQRPKDFNDVAVMSMATTNVFAGSDTTSVSTRAVVYYLLKNQDKKAKFLKELDDMSRQGKLSNPVTLEQANEMPYFQAVIQEALRLHPAVGMSLPRVVPAGGITIGNHLIPAGTVIGTNPWALHHNPAVFGQDAEDFRPERWLEGETGNMHRLFFTFGAGSRLCLGKNIGLMEISKLVPTLFLRYDVQLVHPERDWRTYGYWFVVQDGLEVTMRPRNPDY